MGSKMKHLNFPYDHHHIIFINKLKFKNSPQQLCSAPLPPSPLTAASEDQAVGLWPQCEVFVLKETQRTWVNGGGADMCPQRTGLWKQGRAFFFLLGYKYPHLVL